MQGANTGGQNVWTTYIPQLLANNSPDVIMLQEAVTTTPGAGLLQANLLPSQGGSDLDPVSVIQTPTRPAPTTAPEPTYSFDPMPVGGYATNGANASSTLGYSGMRQPLRVCMQQYGNSCARVLGSLELDDVEAPVVGDIVTSGNAHHEIGRKVSEVNELEGAAAAPRFARTYCEKRAEVCS
jgi:hypothetical protein